MLQTNSLPARLCQLHLDVALTPHRSLQIKGCGSVAAQIDGRVGGAGKRMRAVDGKQEINLEWPKNRLALLAQGVSAAQVPKGDVFVWFSHRHLHSMLC